jgi:hypothetical protein
MLFKTASVGLVEILQKFDVENDDCLSENIKIMKHLLVQNSLLRTYTVTKEFLIC